VELATPRAGTFARAGQSTLCSTKEVRTAARLRRSGDEAWGDVAPRYAAAVRFEIRNKKARSGFFRCGLYDFCDDEDMPVICPTCQSLFLIT
jgi:hypothetical protein